MKKLFLLLPLLALASCSYPSKYEAEAACDEWARKGGRYIYVRYKDNQTSLAGKYLAGELTPDEYLQAPEYTEDKYRIRDCQHESETRQYIGWDKGTKAGEKYYSGELPEWKIIKRFRY